MPKTLFQQAMTYSGAVKVGNEIAEFQESEVAGLHIYNRKGAGIIPKHIWQQQKGISIVRSILNRADKH